MFYHLSASQRIKGFFYQENFYKDIVSAAIIFYLLANLVLLVPKDPIVSQPIYSHNY